MYLTPEKELYTIVQQFYSGKYHDIAQLNLESEFDFSNILYDFEANFYKIRSFIILNDYPSASSLLSSLEKRITETSSQNLIDAQTTNALLLDIKTLNYYINSSSNELPDFINSIDENQPSLALVYKHKLLSDNKQISVSNPDLDLESYISLLFSNSIIENSPIQISKLTDLKSHYSDSLILDFALAWLGLINNNTDDNDNINTKSAYYFFDELSSSSNTNSVKILTNLLACHLKLNNIPESLDVLKSLQSISSSSTLPSWDYSLLINQIALASITSDSEKRSQLIDQIENKFPDSPYVNDLNEKSTLFDSIVAEYN